MKAYTLVELLGVVVIILIFSTILVASNRNATQSAQSVTAQQQQAELQTAVEAWIASQPTLYVAVKAWGDQEAGGTFYDWLKDNPLSLLSNNAANTFKVVADGFTSPASLGQTTTGGKGTRFQIAWSYGNQAGKLTQGPIVSQTDNN